MSVNRFYSHRHEIAALSKKLGLDAEAASMQYAINNKWSNYTEELKEWRATMRRYQMDKTKTLADLFK